MATNPTTPNPTTTAPVTATTLTVSNGAKTVSLIAATLEELAEAGAVLTGNPGIANAIANVSALANAALQRYEDASSTVIDDDSIAALMITDPIADPTDGPIVD